MVVSKRTRRYSDYGFAGGYVDLQGNFNTSGRWYWRGRLLDERRVMYFYINEKLKRNLYLLLPHACVRMRVTVCVDLE